MDALAPATTNIAVRDWILQRWPETNRNTIGAQTIVCTVNHASRLHYPENKKPRKNDGRYDFLFRPERGKLELYDPERHGEWEIAETETGRLVVQPRDAEPPPEDPPGDKFAAESHLRDYLAHHLDLIEPGLTLYVDDSGTDGVEFTVPVGRIDILAQDANGGFVVIELKVSRGSDAVVGQMLRYRGWIRRNLANGAPVRGVIIAQRIGDRLRYAAMEVEDILLKEYALSLSLKDVHLAGS